MNDFRESKPPQAEDPTVLSPQPDTIAVEGGPEDEMETDRFAISKVIASEYLEQQVAHVQPEKTLRARLAKGEVSPQDVIREREAVEQAWWSWVACVRSLAAQEAKRWALDSNAAAQAELLRITSWSKERHDGTWPARHEEVYLPSLRLFDAAPEIASALERRLTLLGQAIMDTSWIRAEFMKADEVDASEASEALIDVPTALPEEYYPEHAAQTIDVEALEAVPDAHGANIPGDTFAAGDPVPEPEAPKSSPNGVIDTPSTLGDRMRNLFRRAA